MLIVFGFAAGRLFATGFLVLAGFLVVVLRAVMSARLGSDEINRRAQRP
jgi:hypothetical protein